MTKPLNLAGKRFGRITVVKESGRSKAGKTVWRCICDCGAEKNVVGGVLMSGLVKSCGCLSKDTAKEYGQRMRDAHMGETINGMTVLEVPDKPRSNYTVRCGSCGEVSKLPMRRILITGHCGCKTEVNRLSSHRTDSYKAKATIRGYALDSEGYNITRRKDKSARFCRVLAERCLGRDLLSNEIVHHHNGISFDDRPDNYRIVCSVADHIALHHRARELCRMAGDRILITGGAGFLGRNLSLYLYSHSNARILIYSRDDSKHESMRRWLMGMGLDLNRFDFFVGDIRDLDRLRLAFRGCSTVIHAAAWKIIPSAELDPMECVQTNVHGTENVIRAAIDCMVTNVVGVSTDKAAGQISNIYGHTKAIMERLLVSSVAYNKDGLPKFTCSRFGNVSHSTSSVLPYWMERSLCGSISVTDPEMTRYWMDISEAIDCVMEAVAAAPGEIISHLCPSYRLGDLAEAFRELSGCHVETTGSRPGERMYEELISETERYSAVGSILNIGSGYLHGPYRTDTNKQWLSRDDLKRRIISCQDYWLKLLREHGHTT